MDLNTTITESSAHDKHHKITTHNCESKYWPKKIKYITAKSVSLFTKNFLQNHAIIWALSGILQLIPDVGQIFASSWNICRVFFTWLGSQKNQSERTVTYLASDTSTRLHSLS